MCKVFIKDIEGFKIYFEEVEEFEAIEDMLSFELTGVDYSETINAVNDGIMAYFVAKVTAEKNNIELSSDYLGGCVYDDVSDFYQEKSGYFDDMVKTVVIEAKKVIKNLCV